MTWFTYQILPDTLLLAQRRASYNVLRGASFKIQVANHIIQAIIVITGMRQWSSLHKVLFKLTENSRFGMI